MFKFGKQLGKSASKPALSLSMIRIFSFCSFSTTFKNTFLNRPFALASSSAKSSVSASGPEFIKFQKFYMRSMKTKRKLRMPNTKYKIKNHTGLMKRIRIVGPRWDRGFKFWPTNFVHKRTNKSRANLKSKKQARYIGKADITRVKMLIPMWKRQKYKH